jgi:hypothetical protein
MPNTAQIEEITQGLYTEIAELEKLYGRLPEVIAKKKAQLSKLQEVAKILEEANGEDESILRSLMGMSGAPARAARARKQRGPNLPTRVMTLLNAAGPRGLEFRGILGNLEEAEGGSINRSHLATTLKRLVEREKVENVAGRFRVV